MREDYLNLLRFLELYVTRNNHDREIIQLKHVKEMFEWKCNKAETSWKLHPGHEQLQQEYVYWKENVTRIETKIRQNEEAIAEIKGSCRKRLSLFPTHIQNKLMHVLEETCVEHGIERILKILRGFSYEIQSRDC